MKRPILFVAVIALLAACSTKEVDFQTPIQDDVVFYALFEQPADDATRVYANEDLLLRWTADDRVSIFNKLTYNQEYKFTGQTGANAGGFRKVDNDEFVTGNGISHVVSVYPYQESTTITEEEVINLTLPGEQSYAENTFGLGANTMVAVSSDNVLQYKNVGGYMMLKLYGEGVSVSSITLKGNNGEKLAGNASVTMPLDGVPSAAMANDATTEITLVCESPIQLGATADEYTQFWFVVPPMTFEKGFTITVKDSNNGSAEKSTSNRLEISRNKLAKMSAFEVVPEPSDDAIVFADENVKAKLVAAFDTNGDGELSYKEAAAVISGDDLKSAFGTVKTYKSFREFQYFTSVKSIPESFFSSWNQLSAIEIPSSVESIGNYAFKNCACLSSIVLPENLLFLGYGVFAGCSSLKRIRIPDSISGVLGRFISLEYSNPSGFYGDGMFEDCTSLEEVVLSKNITVLGVFTFYNCPELSNLVIPSSIEVFNIGTFSGCKKLVSVSIPESMTIIPSQLFSDCSSLSTLTIPDHITKIGSSAISGCSSLTSISIPESVSTIGNSAFAGCLSLTSISIPESISVIETSLFNDCESLESVTIPESITSIGDYSFANCFKLDNVDIPESVTSIGKEAFRNCLSLSSISIPENVSSIGQRAFSRCSNLVSINLPDTSISFPEAFQYCTGLTSIELPAKISDFSYAFQYCTGLKNVSFSEGINHVSRYSFLGCESIESIIIPESVTNIYGGAFMGCSGLNYVRVNSSIPPTGSSQMFINTNDCPIYVPAESVEAYKSANKWSDYADRIQAIAPLPEAVDLGLSVKWASFNLGASKPEEYGDYFAWGETEPYYSSQDPLTWKEGKEEGYWWPSYKWCMGTSYTFTKYCNDSSRGYNGFTDNKTVLDPEDDVANVNLGGKWRMPTYEECSELLTNCTSSWITINGVNGREFTSNINGNCIFLPASGDYFDTRYDIPGSSGSYLSSSLHKSDANKAWSVSFSNREVRLGFYSRAYGYAIRPVYAE